MNGFLTSATGVLLALTLHLKAGTFMTFEGAGDGRWHDVNKVYSNFDIEEKEIEASLA